MEILFKAQRADGKGWVEGDYFNAQSGLTIITNGGESMEDFHFILPETLCQLVTEINETKIFKGDILDIEYEKSDFHTGVHKGVEVYFNEEKLQWCVRGGNIKTTAVPTSLTGYVNPVYTVVGNIYDKN